MSNIINDKVLFEPIGKNTRYGTEKELRDLILYKRINKWDAKKLELEDGTIIKIEMSDYDCCAYACGEFIDAKLDAVITDFEVVKVNDDRDDTDDEITNKVIVKIYHNQNPIALAECSANNGNGGYYYSVASLVIGDIHFPVVRAWYKEFLNEWRKRYG